MLKRALSALLVATLLAFGSVGCGDDDAAPAITPEKCIAEGFNATRTEIVKTLAPKMGGDENAVKKQACTCALTKPGATADMGALGGALSSCLGELGAEALGM